MQALKLPLAAVAVSRIMCVVPVVLELLLGCKDARTVTARIPMLSLLMLKAQFPSVGGPSSPTPAAFDLVHVTSTVVEMVPYPIVGEATATALGHIVISYLSLWSTVEGWNGSGGMGRNMTSCRKVKGMDGVFINHCHVRGDG